MNRKTYVERCIYQYQKKDGTTAFYVEVRRKGLKKPLTKVEKNISKARQWLKSTEVAIDEGKELPDSKARKRTLNDLIEQYKKIHLSKFPLRLEDQIHQLNWWQEHYGERLLISITPSLLCEAQDVLVNGTTSRKTSRTNSTVNRYFSTLSKAFSLAAKSWGWITETPFKRIYKLPENPGRTRFLTQEELITLLEQCKCNKNDNLYGMVLIAGTMGLRFGEIAKLQWEHIDFEHEFMTIAISKNGDSRVVPLTDQVSSYLKERSASKTQKELLFPPKNLLKHHQYSLIRKAFQKALDLANIKDFKFHDLRHTCASHLAMNGASQGELMDILGHNSPTMTKRYAHYSKKHIKRLMQKTSNQLIGNIVQLT